MASTIPPQSHAQSGFTVRAAGPDDLPFLDDMLWEAAAVSAEVRAMGKPVALAHPWLRKYVDHWGRRGDLAVIAVAPDGKRLGATWCRLFPADEAGYGYVGDDVPELSIGVTPAARGRGVGAALIVALLAAARNAGFHAVSLSVDRQNPAARLYTRLGFRDAGVSPDDDTSVTMVIDL